MQTLLKLSIALGLAGLTALTSLPAAAQYGRGHYGVHYRGPHVGVYFGGPLYSPFYYPAPYYYGHPQTVYVQPAAPTVYVERNDVQATAPAAPQAAPPAAQSSPPPDSYWYYCPDSKTYYPYVNSCASPWQRVSPQPPSASR